MRGEETGMEAGEEGAEEEEWDEEEGEARESLEVSLMSVPLVENTKEEGGRGVRSANRSEYRVLFRSGNVCNARGGEALIVDREGISSEGGSSGSSGWDED